MRFTFAFTALSVAFSVVSAATFTPRQLPNCAAACLAEANYGGCNSDDDTCLCNSQVFIQSSTQCIQQTCTGSDLTTAESDAQQLCLAVGVTLTSSTPAATGSSAASSPTPSSNGATANKINALAGAAAFVALAAIL